MLAPEDFEGGRDDAWDSSRASSVTPAERAFIDRFEAMPLTAFSGLLLSKLAFFLMAAGWPDKAGRIQNPGAAAANTNAADPPQLLVPPGDRCEQLRQALGPTAADKDTVMTPAALAARFGPHVDTVQRFTAPPTTPDALLALAEVVSGIHQALDVSLQRQSAICGVRSRPGQRAAFRVRRAHRTGCRGPRTAAVHCDPTDSE
jgi:hypothetical protein